MVINLVMMWITCLLAQLDIILIGQVRKAWIEGIKKAYNQKWHKSNLRIVLGWGTIQVKYFHKSYS